MVGWMTVQETAERWNLTTRRVAVLCKENRIPDVERDGHRWLIPADAEKPADKRVRSGAYGKATATSLLPLPVGVSDFKKAVTDYYYVDKTLLIRDFIDELPAVTLFTRPRRFGKTLNMDMIRTYFEKTEEDTSVYFKDIAMSERQKSPKNQGKPAMAKTGNHSNIVESGAHFW